MLQCLLEPSPSEALFIVTVPMFTETDLGDKIPEHIYNHNCRKSSDIAISRDKKDRFNPTSEIFQLKANLPDDELK